MKGANARDLFHDARYTNNNLLLGYPVDTHSNDQIEVDTRTLFEWLNQFRCTAAKETITPWTNVYHQ